MVRNRLSKQSPMVRLAFAVTAANAAAVLGIAIAAVIGIQLGQDSFGLFVVAQLVGYACYLVVGFRALDQIVGEELPPVARKALVVAPLVAFALWLPLNTRVPGIEWTPLFFPYPFVLGSVAFVTRGGDSNGSRFRGT